MFTVCAVNPSICASDVSDSQTTQTCDRAPAPPSSAAGSVWRLAVAVCNVAHPGLFPGRRLCEWRVDEHGSLRCPLSALHSPAPSHAFRAETDACAGASASSFPPFRKQTPEEKTDPHRSVHPSVHTDWVSDHAAVPSFQPGTESSVSKAASPSKQSNIRAILQRSRSSLSSFKN